MSLDSDDTLHPDERPATGAPSKSAEDADVEAVLRQLQDDAERDFTEEQPFQALHQRMKNEWRTAADVPAATTPEAQASTVIQGSFWGQVDAQFGDYRLLEEVGRGAMGVVFRAWQLSLHRVVALKLVLAGEFASDEEVERFHLEAAAAANLEHPAIVPVFEVGEIDGRHYYSMRYIEGASLAERLVDGPLDPREAAQLLVHVAGGIHYAHQQGVIHRDLKPSNILLSEPSSLGSEWQTGAKIADFGLAKQLDADSNLTRTGQILGTPQYMPPEQARGELEVGPAADVYSIGAVLYATLTGRPPYQAANSFETMQQAVSQEVVAPRRLNPSIPADLETICLKCLKKQPTQRYASAEQLAADLQRFLNGEPIVARPVSAMERMLLWAKRHPSAAGSLAAAAVAFIAIVGAIVLASQLNASHERSRRLEADAMLRGSQLANAAALAAQQADAAAVQEYYLRVNRVRRRALEPAAGWAFESLQDLERAVSLKADVADVVELRSEAARCLMGVDVRPTAEVMMPRGYQPHVLAFHPRGEQLAIATLVHLRELCVLVCDPVNGQVLHDLRAPAKAIGLIGLDGIRHLAFLGDGEALAIVTRSGWLHRWSLDGNAAPEQRLRSIEMKFAQPKPFAFDGPRRRAYYCRDGKLCVWRDFSKPDDEELLPLDAKRLCVSDDGRMLAATGESLRILDTETNRVVQEIQPFSTLASFSADGRTIAGVAHRLHLANVEQGNVYRTLVDPAIDAMHEDAVTQAQFSASGALVVTCGHDQKFKLWDTARAELLLSVVIPGANEVRAILDPTESVIAATARDRVILYALNGPGVCETAAQTAEPVMDFDLARSPEVLAVGAESAERRGAEYGLWDPASRQWLDRWWRRDQCWHHFSMAISADASCVVAGDRLSSQIHRWQLDSEQLNATQQAQPGRWTPAPTLLFRGQEVRRALGANVGPPQSCRSWGLPWEQVDAAVNWGDGRACFFRGDEFCEYDINLGRRLGGPKKMADHWTGMGSDPVDAALLWRDSRTYLLRGGQVVHFDRSTLASGKAKQLKSRFGAELFDSFVDAAYRRDALGKELVFTQDLDARVVQLPQAFGPRSLPEIYDQWSDSMPLDAAVNLAAKTKPHFRLLQREAKFKAAKVRAVAVSADGDRHWAVVDDNDVAGWSSSKREPQHVWSNKLMSEIAGVGTLSDIDVGKQWVAIGANSLSVNLLSVESGAVAAATLVPSRPSCVRLNRRQDLVACGDLDGQLFLVSVPGGKELVRIDGHHDEVTALDFSPDGALLASGGGDKALMIWQVQEEQLKLLMRLPQQAVVQQVRFSPDGQRLFVSIKGEPAVRVWQLDRLIAELQSLQLGW